MQSNWPADQTTPGWLKQLSTQIPMLLIWILKKRKKKKKNVRLTYTGLIFLSKVYNHNIPTHIQGHKNTTTSDQFRLRTRLTTPWQETFTVELFQAEFLKIHCAVSNKNKNLSSTSHTVKKNINIKSQKQKKNKLFLQGSESSFINQNYRNKITSFTACKKNKNKKNPSTSTKLQTEQ